MTSRHTPPGKDASGTTLIRLTRPVIGGTGNPDDGKPVSEARYNWIGKDLWQSLKDGTFRSDGGAA